MQFWYKYFFVRGNTALRAFRRAYRQYTILRHYRRSESARIQGISIEIKENSRKFHGNQQEIKEFPSSATKVQGISIEIKENSMNFHRNQRESKEFPLDINENQRNFNRNQGEFKEFPPSATRIPLGLLSRNLYRNQ